MASPNPATKYFDNVVMMITARDQNLPVSINWSTNYNFALFSKLPTNYTQISEKIQFTYQNAPLRGAFTYVFCIFSEIFV